MVSRKKLSSVVLLLAAVLLINSAGASLVDVVSTYVDEDGARWLKFKIPGEHDFVMCINEKQYQELLKDNE